MNGENAGSSHKGCGSRVNGGGMMGGICRVNVGSPGTPGGESTAGADDNAPPRVIGNPALDD